MSVTEGTILRIVPTILFPDDVVAQAVFHVVLTTIVGGGDEDDVTDDLSDYAKQIYLNLQAEMADLMTSGEVKVYEYDPIDEDFDEVGTGSLGINFTTAGEWMPHGVALVQNYYTSDPDVQGRKYLFGLMEQRHTDGDWTAAAITAAAALATDVVSSYTGLVTANIYTPGVWSPTKGNFFVYSGVVANNATVGYQRRRKPGVGI